MTTAVASARVRRQLRVLERIAEALEKLATQNEATPLETVDVRQAALLLHTTPRAVYVRHQRGQMPTPLPGRKLLWRKSDLLRGT